MEDAHVIKAKYYRLKHAQAVMKMRQFKACGQPVYYAIASEECSHYGAMMSKYRI